MWLCADSASIEESGSVWGGLCQGNAQVEFAGRSMERAHRERRRSRDVSVDDRKPDRNVIRALRPLRNNTPATLSASCYGTAINVKGSSRRAVHLSGSLEKHVRLQKVLGSAKPCRMIDARASAIADACRSPSVRLQFAASLSMAEARMSCVRRGSVGFSERCGVRLAHSHHFEKPSQARVRPKREPLRPRTTD
ncbi:hypothetical protein AWB80_07990 [Caballeronia pedi]|uniref:Uncharacterized protein n=1 Tax=Caballeronia pedi TaxID=1777141 RepID=A0A158E1W4_9BURK|nr:hypothetical protein AWB80_07990 [Caballeronia pedi]